MIRRREVPYSSSDLRDIADRVDKIVTALNPGDDFLPEGDWRWGLTVEVFDPDFDTSVGQVKAHGDGWLAFYPWGATDE